MSDERDDNLGDEAAAVADYLAGAITVEEYIDRVRDFPSMHDARARAAACVAATAQMSAEAAATHDRQH